MRAAHDLNFACTQTAQFTTLLKYLSRYSDNHGAENTVLLPGQAIANRMRLKETLCFVGDLGSRSFFLSLAIARIVNGNIPHKNLC